MDKPKSATKYPLNRLSIFPSNKSVCVESINVRHILVFDTLISIQNIYINEKEGLRF